MLTRKDFAGKERPTWCPGCGNHAILNGIKMALAEHNIAPHQVLIVTGIGCGSKLPHYMKVTGYHSLHGRTAAVATGARLANHGLRVLTVHGDGDGYGEGLSHFLNAIRRNVRIVDVIQDNRIYGLTKGQYSPTSERGKRTPTSEYRTQRRGGRGLITIKCNDRNGRVVEIKEVADNQELIADSRLIEVTPVKDFVTYGIGIPLMKMRDPEQARGRAPVGVQYG